MLHYLRVVYGRRQKMGVLDGILCQFSPRLIKDSVSHLHANAFRQTKNDPAYKRELKLRNKVRTK
jgi:hypothetical protein